MPVSERSRREARELLRALAHAEGRPPPRFKRMISGPIAIHGLDPETGAIVARFDSVASAAAAGFVRSTIHSIVTGQTKSKIHRGLQWVRVGSSETLSEHNARAGRASASLSRTACEGCDVQTGDVVVQFGSIREAQAAGFFVYVRHLRGTIKHGLRWRRAQSALEVIASV